MRQPVGAIVKKVSGVRVPTTGSGAETPSPDAAETDMASAED
jgi:hypothetical protein